MPDRLESPDHHKPTCTRVPSVRFYPLAKVGVGKPLSPIHLTLRPLKTSVRRVLFNVGGITLFSSIFRVTFFGRSISRRVSVWLWTFVASVAGRNGRHMTGHVWLHRNVRKLNCSRNLASPVKTISDFALHIAGTILMLAVWWRLGG
jgi:hypothetical protein